MRKNAKKIKNSPGMNIFFNVNVDFLVGSIPIL